MSGGGGCVFASFCHIPTVLAGVSAAVLRTGVLGCQESEQVASEE